MSNKFESCRETIKATIQDVVVKVSIDGGNTSFTWSIAKCYEECGVACHIDNVEKLPSEFKSIVSFEFNKLKEATLSKDGFDHIKSREGYAYKDDQIVASRNDSFIKRAIPLAEQLKGAVILLSRVEKSIEKAESPEKRSNLHKRFNRYAKEINWLRDEIAAQEKVVAEINEAATELTQANISASEVFATHTGEQ